MLKAKPLLARFLKSSDSEDHAACLSSVIWRQEGRVSVGHREGALALAKKKMKLLFLSLAANLVILRIFSKPLSGNIICHRFPLILFIFALGSFPCQIQSLLVEDYIALFSDKKTRDYYRVFGVSLGKKLYVQVWYALGSYTCDKPSHPDVISLSLSSE